MLIPTHNYQKHVITEVQSTTRACTNAPRHTPSGTSSLVYSAQRRTSPTTYENFPNDQSHIPKQRKKGKKKEYLYLFRWSLSAPAVIRVRRGVPPGNPGGTLGSPVLSGSCSRVEWVPPGLPEVMLWTAGTEDSIVGRLLSRYSLLLRRAHGGYLLQTCVPNMLSFKVKYNYNVHINYISEKCLAYSWLFQDLISIC